MKMKEMLLVGRGGEGVVVASQLLADTLARAGYWVQSFPEFKAERRGAPISAFLRWSGEPIHRRYKMRDCDVLAVVTPSPPASALTATVRPGGAIILNSKSRVALSGEVLVARVAASRIARRNGVLSAEGRPMGNVALLGACVRLLLPHGLPFLEEAIAARLGPAAVPNIAAARDGYAQCVRQHSASRDVAVAYAPPAPKRVGRAMFPISTELRGRETGTWSLDRPVLLDPCNGCALCALFCPEGAMSRRGGEMTIEYLYCKGCGICEDVCPVRGAIEMHEVPA